jgi:hypothetical protein
MDCGSYRGVLWIVYVQKTPGVVQPNTQAYLDSMGLGQINSIGTLIVTRFVSDWGTNTITFGALSSLVQATGGIFTGRFSIAIDPPFPVTAFPGLANVRQVGGDVFEYGTLVTSPSWTNLQCVGGAMGWFGVNTQTTLVGMDKLVQVNYVPTSTSGAVITIDGQSPIATGSALAPLATAANCGGVPPPLGVSILLPAVCTIRITTWAALCTFIATGACP